MKKKRWSKMLEEVGVRIRLYERANSSSIWYSLTRDGKKVRGSLRTGNRVLAEDRGRQVARSLAELELTGRRPDTMTLSQILRLYFREKGPLLSETRRAFAETVQELFLTAWGPDLTVADLGQSQVDQYVHARRNGSLCPVRVGRTPQGVRAGTIDSDLRWMSSVFNWARKYKQGGHRLVSENPLRELTWPKETNVQRPIASHERFVASMEYVDSVDPEGRLRCILALARYTGRRESAICNLRASDVLPDAPRIRAALAAAGMDERLAEYMPHGAIRWSDEHDKQGFLFISPISEPARRELDAYARRSLRMGEAPLFPAPGDPLVSIRRDVPAKWLVKAEKLAGLPKLRRGVFHPYRRLWASERKHLPDVDVAAAAGWKDARALKLSYQQADPASVLRVVESQ